MKPMLRYLAITISLLFASPAIGISQPSVIEAKGYLIDRVEEPLSISKRQLNQASIILDLNKNYKPEWVKEYRSVEVVTIHNGMVRKAVSVNDVLSQEQKDNMYSIDDGSEIVVRISYLPENHLVHNDVKEMEFAFQVHPAFYAVFADGEERLGDYLEENKIHDIVETAFIDEGLIAVKFTINKEGGIEDVHLVESSKDVETDARLIMILKDMPSWKPAEYSSGLKVKQEMILTAGNLESCVMNLVKYNKNRIN